jgi:recombination protein RecA
MAEDDFDLPLAVKGVFKAMNKKYGGNTVSLLGDDPKIGLYKRVWTTGSLALDLSIGGVVRNDDGTIDMGIPSGKVIEIFGSESCGKTTLCNIIMANAQKRGGLCAFIDMEQSWNRAYAEALGVETDKLVFVQPDHGDAAVEITESLIKTGQFSIVVIDSIAAMTPKEVFESDIEDRFYAALPKLVNRLLNKTLSPVRDSDCTLICTNQMREKVGVMYGNPEMTPGGRFFKHAAYVRLQMRKKEQFKDSDAVIGHEVSATPVKNKCACPQNVATFRIMYKDGGIDPAFDVMRVGIARGLVTRAGSWYSYNGNQIGQGSESVREWLVQNPDKLAELRSRIISAAFQDTGEEIDEQQSQEEQVDEPSF